MSLFSGVPALKGGDKRHNRLVVALRRAARGWQGGAPPPAPTSYNWGWGGEDSLRPLCPAKPPTVP